VRVGFFDYKLLIHAATDNSFLLYYIYLLILVASTLRDFYYNFKSGIRQSLHPVSLGDPRRLKSSQQIPMQRSHAPVIKYDKRDPPSLMNLPACVMTRTHGWSCEAIGRTRARTRVRSALSVILYFKSRARVIVFFSSLSFFRGCSQWRQLLRPQLPIATGTL